MSFKGCVTILLWGQLVAMGEPLFTALVCNGDAKDYSTSWIGMNSAGEYA